MYCTHTKAMPMQCPAGRWKRLYGLDPIDQIRSRRYPIITPAAVVCRVYLSLSLSQYVHYTRRPRGRANDKYNVSLTVKSFKTTEVKKNSTHTHTEIRSRQYPIIFHMLVSDRLSSHATHKLHVLELLHMISVCG